MWIRVKINCGMWICVYVVLFFSSLQLQWINWWREENEKKHQHQPPDLCFDLIPPYIHLCQFESLRVYLFIVAQLPMLFSQRQLAINSRYAIGMQFIHSFMISQCTLTTSSAGRYYLFYDFILPSMISTGSWRLLAA